MPCLDPLRNSVSSPVGRHGAVSRLLVGKVGLASEVIATQAATPRVIPETLGVLDVRAAQDLQVTRIATAAETKADPLGTSLIAQVLVSACR
jgi:hypothetical protein